MTTHVEFKIGVTVWSLEEPEYRPCPELLEMCDILGAPRLVRSPAELYPTERPILAIADHAADCFLSIDTTGPRDGMEVVTVCVRCVARHADRIEALLRLICSRSEIKTAFLHGDLGLNRPPHTE